VQQDRQHTDANTVYSRKARAGRRRTYFFDVRRTNNDDLYITLTESIRRDDGSYERHKIRLYKEDFHRFLDELEFVVDEVKRMLPDFDYNAFYRNAPDLEDGVPPSNGMDTPTSLDEDWS
jgi:hypothetical protein